MKETIADVSSASPSSERMRGLWVNGVKKGLRKKLTSEEMYEFFDWLL